MEQENIRMSISRNVLDYYIENKDGCERFYSAANNEFIKEIYDDISDDAVIIELLSRVSIVILTANKYEKNILHHLYSKGIKRSIPRWRIKLTSDIIDPQMTQGFYMKWGDYSVVHIEALSTGSHTRGGSADLVRYLFDNAYIYPVAILSFGVCFGLDEANYRLGDVIISEKLYPYFQGAKITADEFYVNDNNTFRIDNELKFTVNRLFGDNILSEHRDRAFFKSYITGEAVLSNYEIRDKFAKAATNQPVVGGEMEGYGVFKECRGYFYNIPCMIIKSICDWGVVKNLEQQDIQDIIDTETDENKKRILTEIKNSPIKEMIQAYTASRSFYILEKLLNIDNHVFSVSVYDIAKEIIIRIRDETNDKVVSTEQIHEKLNNSGFFTRFNRIPSQQYIEQIIEDMISDRLVYRDDDSGNLLITD